MHHTRRAFALARDTLSRSQADLVLFLIPKWVREPFYLTNDIKSVVDALASVGRKGCSVLREVQDQLSKLVLDQK